MSPLGKTLVSAFAAETNSHAVDGLGRQAQLKGAFACFSKGHFSHFVPRRQGPLGLHVPVPTVRKIPHTHIFANDCVSMRRVQGQAEVAAKAQEEHAKARVRRMDEEYENKGE
jgi:hypothetical protein